MGSLTIKLLEVVDRTFPDVSIRSQCQNLRKLIIENESELNVLGARILSEQLSHQNRVDIVYQVGTILLGERAVSPADKSYDCFRKRNWSTSCWLTTGCFLVVQNTAEVATILRIIVYMGVQFAIRSGGHNPNPNFGSISAKGVVIDLSGIDHTKLSEDGSYVNIGPGTTWDRVYEFLEAAKLTVAGGRVDGVGVGGLILGGGMSHFSNHWGLVADNVKNYEVVLGDSKIVQANAEVNPDLFRALKGGGPNLGIITRCDLFTYPDYKIWYSFRIYSAREKEKVMAATVRIQHAMEQDDKIGFFLTVAKDTMTAGLLYREWSNFPEVFSEFNDIPILMEAIPGTNGTQLSACKACAVKDSARYEIGTVTVRPEPQTYVEHHSALENVLEGSELNIAFTYQPISAQAIEKGKMKGGNVLNMPAENQCWLGIMGSSKEDAKDANIRGKIDQLIESIKTLSESRDQLLDFQFMNDSSYQQNPLESYGAENVAFLNAMSEKYDKDRVFQIFQESGFLLAKA